MDVSGEEFLNQECKTPPNQPVVISIRSGTVNCRCISNAVELSKQTMSYEQEVSLEQEQAYLRPRVLFPPLQHLSEYEGDLADLLKERAKE